MEEYMGQTVNKSSWWKRNKAIVGFVMLILFIVPYLNGGATLMNNFSTQGIGGNLWGLFLLIGGVVFIYTGLKKK